MLCEYAQKTFCFTWQECQGPRLFSLLGQNILSSYFDEY